MRYLFFFDLCFVILVLKFIIIFLRQKEKPPGKHIETFEVTSQTRSDHFNSLNGVPAINTSGVCGTPGVQDYQLQLLIDTQAVASRRSRPACSAVESGSKLSPAITSPYRRICQYKMAPTVALLEARGGVVIWN